MSRSTVSCLLSMQELRMFCIWRCPAVHVLDQVHFYVTHRLYNFVRVCSTSQYKKRTIKIVFVIVLLTLADLEDLEEVDYRL